MKRLLIIGFLLTTVICKAQMQPSDINSFNLLNIKIIDNEYRYDTVFTTKNNSQVVYNNLVSWSNSYFRNSKDAIQQADQSLGQLFINGNFDVSYRGDNYSGESKIYFKCRIYIKDYRVRVILIPSSIDTFDNLVYLIKVRPDSFLTEALKQSNSSFQHLLLSINQRINAKSESDF